MPEADALLESAATNVVREYLEKRRYGEQTPSPPELSPELIGGLKARVARPLVPRANLVEPDDREPAEGNTDVAPRGSAAVASAMLDERGLLQI